VVPNNFERKILALFVKSLYFLLKFYKPFTFFGTYILVFLNFFNITLHGSSFCLVFSPNFRFAQSHNLVCLRDVALSFIYNNFFAVSGEEEFLDTNKVPYAYISTGTYTVTVLYSAAQYGIAQCGTLHYSTLRDLLYSTTSQCSTVAQYLSAVP
jgi:hypothetical protein